MTAAARLVVYSPDGARRGFAATPASWNASFPVDDVPSITINYPVAAPGADLLSGPCEVAVELWDGTGWIEPVNGRYCMLETTADTAKADADVITRTGRGYAQLADDIPVLPQQFNRSGVFDSAGKRQLLSATVGQITQTILAEARGLVPTLHPQLAIQGAASIASKDSAGADWAKRITIAYDPGISLLTALTNLAQQGQCDWWTQGRTLVIVNPDSTARTLPLRLAGDPTQQPVRATIAGLRHTVILAGDAGTAWKQDNTQAGVAHPWGDSITVLTQAGVKDQATATSLIATELAAGTQERVEYTRAWPLTDHAPTPFIDFGPGDYVQARNRQGTWESMRVWQITLSWDAKGLACNLTLNDRFLDAQVRAARRQKGIVNGAVGDAGTGAIPTRPATAIPRPPVGVVATSNGYWDADGLPRAAVTVSWAPVQLDTDGRAINLSGYEVTVTPDAQLTVAADTTSAALSGFGVNTAVTAKVRAVSSFGIRGDWSYGVQITTESPAADVQPPTAPVVSTALGTVTVTWDGQVQGASQPVPAPAALASVAAEDAPSVDGPWRRQTGSGQWVYTDIPVGAQHWFRLLAIDRLGRESAPSLVASITVASQVQDQLDGLGQRIDETAVSLITDQRLQPDSLTVWPFKPGAVPDGTFTGNEIADWSLAVTKFAANRTNHYLY